MPWLQLAVNSRHPEFVEELLLAAGAQAVSLVDAADHPVLEPAPGATPLWPQTKALGLFNADVDLNVVRALLRDNLPEPGDLAFEETQIEDQDWVRAWLQHARPLRFGKRLWICPSGHRVDAADAVVIDLDPGLAFGTGTHPSTVLCLEWLADADLKGRRVLDYGCGSGVLAIAALKLGASNAQATDIDPQALLASADNAARNGVTARLRSVMPEQLDAPSAAYDVVLANILAGPLIALAPQLALHVKPGGWIVLAGLLQRQADEVRAAYASWFDFDHPGEREGWTRLNGHRRTASI